MVQTLLPIKKGKDHFDTFNAHCPCLIILHLPFSVEKKNLGNTIHYTYMSYNEYFRLCVVSEELRLNEIGLFL